MTARIAAVKSVHAGAFGALIAFVPLLNCTANAQTEIIVVCERLPTTNEAVAGQICDEAITFLGSMVPDRRFVWAEHKPLVPAEAVLLTVTHASDRGAGLDVAWQTSAGKRIDGKPLRVSFFDKVGDPAMRHAFLTTFFNQNPLPF